MDDECFVADVDDATNSATCPEGSHSSRIIFDRSVVVTVFDFLHPNANNTTFYKKKQNKRDILPTQHGRTDRPTTRKIISKLINHNKIE